jgi:hypothetical protein
VISTDEFRNYFFTLLGITEHLDLQERYLHHLDVRLNRKYMTSFASRERYLQNCEHKQCVIEMLANNYLNVILNFNYTAIAKYATYCKDYIYIGNYDIRTRVYMLLDQHMATNSDFKYVKRLFEFENDSIPKIAQLVIDNYIKNVNVYKRISCKKQCESIIYGSQECQNMINQCLSGCAHGEYDYTTIIINNIVNILVK